MPSAEQPAANILFDHEEVTTTDLYAFATHLDRKLLSASLDLFRESWIANLKKAQLFFRISIYERSTFKLSTLLYGTSTYTCTIPRDRIYALLSLLPDREGLPETVYETSDQDVCIRFSRAIMWLEKQLLVLQLMRPDLRREEHRKGLPSWSIDLHGLSDHTPLESSQINIGQPRDREYSASNNLAPELKQPQDPLDPVLELKAQPLGTIRDCLLIETSQTSEPTIWGTPRTRAELRASLRHIASLLHLNINGQKSHTILNTLVETLCVNKGLYRSAFATYFSKYKLEYLDDAGQMIDPSLTEDMLYAVYMSYFGLALISGPDVEPNLARCLAPVEEILVKISLVHLQQYRYVFATSDERIGITYGIVQAGDGIFLVPGSTTPLAFRKLPHTKTAVTYLGDTYVHGVMHAEAFDKELLQKIAVH